MRIPAAPHRWAVSARRAIAIQRNLAARVRAVRPAGRLRLVAGLDAAFVDDRWCIAGVVLWNAQTGSVIEAHVVRRRLTFPYVPGLLSFREAPALLGALRRLRTAPDVLMCDGHGLAHPRRFGIACHIGLLTGLPTIGCAKSRLVGRHRPPAARRGASAPLSDDGEVIGRVLRTQDGINPVFVSVGHLIDLPTATRVVLACAPHYRIPEPTRLADQLVTRAKRAASPSSP